VRGAGRKQGPRAKGEGLRVCHYAVRTLLLTFFDAVDGKQFVVIAAGGGKMGTRSGDAYIIALPD
jgi:hypothetical protein